MHKIATVLAIMLVAASLAGCAADEATPTPTTTTGATPTPTATPSPSPTPVLTTPTVPTVTPNVTAGPTSINITSYEANATAGGNATVCWRVEGTGVVPHTAIHFDNETHADDNVTFADYDGGARYPDNETAQAATGYTLPGDFCTSIPVPATGTVYYRAHVMISPSVSSMLSDEEHTMADEANMTA